MADHAGWCAITEIGRCTCDAAMMQPCRRGCGELVHLENDGFHVCREDAVHAFELQDWQSLLAIKTRLYDDKPLSPDQRRDLANAMDAVMNKAVRLKGIRI